MKYIIILSHKWILLLNLTDDDLNIIIWGKPKVAFKISYIIRE